MNVPKVAEMFANGQSPDILFWVGCAGSFDQRAQKITKAFVSILDKVGINYAILGKEEMCTGDPVRRAGNEFLTTGHGGRAREVGAHPDGLPGPHQ